MSRGFRYLDHPSDLGIEARGESLAQAFEEAAYGLMGVILDPRTVLPAEKLEITLEGRDSENLLFLWLSEILYLFDGKQFVSGRFTIHSLNAHSLRAAISGEPFSPRRHITRMDVKAITYHQLSVVESPAGGLVTVYLDI
jgi:SHS2 domain-containing protein